MTYKWLMRDYQMYNVLVVGLGSMGKRRLRCLKELGYSKISGVDIREDRCNEVMDEFGATTYPSLREISDLNKFDFAFICLPPDLHNFGILWCSGKHIPCFVEASVIIDDVKQLLNSDVDTQNIVPSSTLYFHPAIKKIEEIVNSKRYGKVSNVLLHSGHYLPYWHKYEEVSEYYVSNKVTGGAREIVPFELTWFTQIFGMPVNYTSMIRKTVSIKGAPLIDDTYNILFEFDSFMASVTVDVVSRRATRKLLVNFENAQLVWDWDDNFLKIFTDDETDAQKLYYQKGEPADGYNANIEEDMYIEETKNFISYLNRNEKFPNTLQRDYEVLKILQRIEDQNVLS